MLPPNTILRERYRIIQQLGHGGMGAVYQAMDQSLSCLVAVKEAFAVNEEQRRAFRREAELLANLRHPSLPKVMEHFSENHGDFLVMEFIPGHDLAELLALRGSPFPESEVLGWADELLKVLSYLHGKQLFHRDIKPSNLKLTKEGELFLIDFGLAKGAVGQMPTVVSTKSVHGYTPQYAPHEQIEGQGTDARTDIYSLGATLYHLLTGVAPIDAVTRFQVMKTGGRDPLPLIQSENPLVSPHVAGIIHLAMDISRERRPASAAEMSNALRGLPAGKSESPRRIPSRPPPGPTERSPEQPQATPSPHVPTMPVGPPPKVDQQYNPRIFSTENASLDERPRAGIVKPMLLALGVVLVLVGLSVGLVVWQTGWVPWSDKNLYSETQTPNSTNSNGGTNSASPIGSPGSAVATNTKPSLTPTLTNRQGIEFVLIPSGRFMMGSTNGADSERPVHEVTINYSFYMGKYEVTQAQWQAVMHNNPASFKDCGGNCPVESVSWEDSQKFIQRLNEMNDGYTYRLPSEAEWEYSCRAGTTGDYAGTLDSMAWYANNSGNNYFDADKPSETDAITAASLYPIQLSKNGNRPHRVGTKQANGFGLFDMAGNVTEWCEDGYHASYVGAPTDGSAWVNGGEQGYKVPRGGAWYFSAYVLRSAFRAKSRSDEHSYYYGLRVVAVARTQ